VEGTEGRKGKGSVGEGDRDLGLRAASRTTKRPERREESCDASYCNYRFVSIHRQNVHPSSGIKHISDLRLRDDLEGIDQSIGRVGGSPMPNQL
jgi:hypothetical protein